MLLTDRSIAGPARRVAIVHIPKCAGTSLRASLTGQGVYGGPKYFDWRHRAWVSDCQRENGFNDATQEQFASEQELAEIFQRNAVVLGHYTVHNVLAAGATHVILTVREPRARIVSTYAFWKQYGSSLPDGWGRWGVAAAAATAGTFAEFLKSPAIWPAIRGRIARQVLEGGRITRWSSDRPSPAYLDWMMRARIGRLARIDSAFWPHESEQLINRVGQLVELSPVDYRAANVTTPGVISGEAMSKEDLTMLDKITKADRALLNQFADRGILSRRDSSQLSADFDQTCERLGMGLP